MTDTSIDAVYRAESRRVLATLIRLLRNFELAEEALHDAFIAAAEQWPRDGMPKNPRAWLVSAGRFKAIDKLRRRARFAAAVTELTTEAEIMAEAVEDDEETIADDQLRLIFTCCHPALAPDAQVALTLREVCGLTTEEIAGAFLIPAPTLAQRIVRAKARIRDAAIPYAVPEPAELPDRLETVLHTVYLVFNEGYSAAGRHDLADEAIRLARLIVSLLPEPEAIGLLALMLLHDARRNARISPDGAFVLLADQDRALWDSERIAEGTKLAGQAMAGPVIGSYAIQAAIAAVHTTAPDAESTDWGAIARLYDLLKEAEPTPIVELNRAVAIAMRDGPEAGIALIDAILARGDLAAYHLIHAARADLARRLGRTAEARASYETALRLAKQEKDRRFLEKRLAELPR